MRIMDIEDSRYVYKNISIQIYINISRCCAINNMKASGTVRDHGEAI